MDQSNLIQNSCCTGLSPFATLHSTGVGSNNGKQSTPITMGNESLWRSASKHHYSPFFTSEYGIYRTENTTNEQVFFSGYHFFYLIYETYLHFFKDTNPQNVHFESRPRLVSSCKYILIFSRGLPRNPL